MIHAGTISTGSRMHLARRRRVLDQLDQPVAEDDLARRDGELAPGRNASVPTAASAGDRALPVIEEIHRAAQQVLPAFAQRGVEHFRDWSRGNSTGETTSSKLPGDKGDDLLMMRRDAADAGRRVVPPLLRQQEAWWIRLNGQRCHASPRKRRSCGSGSMQARIRGVAAALAPHRSRNEPPCARPSPEQLPFAGRRREVERPVRVREAEAGRRNAGREPAHDGMKQPVAAGRRIDLGACDGHLRRRRRSRHGSLAGCGLQTEL